eukprot:4763881-Pyramimonas_sp.AAC.1
MPHARKWRSRVSPHEKRDLLRPTDGSVELAAEVLEVGVEAILAALVELGLLEECEVRRLDEAL